MSRANFVDAILTNAKFTGANLSEAIFDNAILTNAKFTGATILNVDIFSRAIDVEKAIGIDYSNADDFDIDDIDDNDDLLNQGEEEKEQETHIHIPSVSLSTKSIIINPDIKTYPDIISGEEYSISNYLNGTEGEPLEGQTAINKQNHVIIFQEQGPPITVNREYLARLLKNPKNLVYLCNNIYKNSTNPEFKRYWVDPFVPYFNIRLIPPLSGYAPASEIKAIVDSRDQMFSVRRNGTAPSVASVLIYHNGNRYPDLSNTCRQTENLYQFQKAKPPPELPPQNKNWSWYGGSKRRTKKKKKHQNALPGKSKRRRR